MKQSQEALVWVQVSEQLMHHTTSVYMVEVIVPTHLFTCVVLMSQLTPQDAVY